jgi:hypothetical protein
MKKERDTATAWIETAKRQYKDGRINQAYRTTVASLREYLSMAEEYEKAGETRSAESNYRMAQKVMNALEGEIAQRRNKLRKNRLEKTMMVAPIIAIAGILGGIFFLSSNITGNAIADMTTKTTSFLGAGLLIVGLVAGFFWLKGRRK